MNNSSIRQLTEISSIYQRLSTGKRINSAADDAAGLAISEKLNAMANGLNQGTKNAQDMQNLLKTAESGLETINDSLLRIKELSVQASNGIYTDEDKALLQNEVGQLLERIGDAAKSTQFNTMKLLDGSFVDKQAVVGANGENIKINLQNTALETLGIDGYDITGDFDISRIDNAIGAVNDARSTIGGYQNRLDYTINSNETGYLNHMQAMSRVADADMAAESTRLSITDVLLKYAIFMKKEQMTQAGNTINLMK